MFDQSRFLDAKRYAYISHVTPNMMSASFPPGRHLVIFTYRFPGILKILALICIVYYFRILRRYVLGIDPNQENESISIVEEWLENAEIDKNEISRSAITVAEVNSFQGTLTPDGIFPSIISNPWSAALLSKSAVRNQTIDGGNSYQGTFVPDAFFPSNLRSATLRNQSAKNSFSQQETSEYISTEQVKESRNKWNPFYQPFSIPDGRYSSMTSNLWPDTPLDHSAINAGVRQESARSTGIEQGMETNRRLNPLYQPSALSEGRYLSNLWPDTPLDHSEINSGVRQEIAGSVGIQPDMQSRNQLKPFNQQPPLASSRGEGNYSYAPSVAINRWSGVPQESEDRKNPEDNAMNLRYHQPNSEINSSYDGKATIKPRSKRQLEKIALPQRPKR